MDVYLSMQRVRFSSPDAYEKFKVVFADVRHHLMKLPGFMHLTWWVHPDDPMWFNECSMWASKEALRDWHMDTYHKHAKAWAANGAIMEDIITNFVLAGTRLLRICPTCNELQDKEYDLRERTGRAARAVPQVRFPLPVPDRDADQLRGVQGHPAFERDIERSRRGARDCPGLTAPPPPYGTKGTGHEIHE